MLCTIDPTVGGVATDQRSIFYNVMCSIHAIATAAAGSTPTVNPVNSSGVRNTNFNCITTIANTEAGGWTAGTSNHYTAASTFTASAAQQFLDLFRLSGKSTYPYYRLAFTTSNHFNGTFSSNPSVQWYCGCTTSDPASVAVTSAEAAYYSNPNNGTYSTATAVAENVNSTNNDHRLRIDESGRTYTVACTSNYLIISAPDYLWYFGLRTVGGWEASRTDNPPWVHFSYTRRGLAGITSNSNTISTNHTDRAAAFGATINPSGTQYGASATAGLYGHRSENTTGNCSLTGMMGLAQTSNFHGSVYQTGLRLRMPLIPNPMFSNWGQFINNNSYYFYADSVTADTVSGLSVPPVYPVVFSTTYETFWSSATGIALGIYKGMNATATATDNFVTGTSYTIGSDTYVPVRTGNTTYRDLWFLRSA